MIKTMLTLSDKFRMGAFSASMAGDEGHGRHGGKTVPSVFVRPLLVLLLGPNRSEVGRRGTGRCCTGLKPSPNPSAGHTSRRWRNRRAHGC